MADERTIAYFTMEIGLESEMPTYAGGLGILAGDTIRAAADANLPLVAVTLLHRKGYFYQRLDADGMQHEEPVNWSVDDYLSEVPARVTLNLEPVDPGTTLVSIREAGWPTDREGVQRALGQTAGWTYFLCCLKAYLQHGINLRLGLTKRLTEL